MNMSSKKYISLCMNFKDEGPYLKEWVDFHLCTGIEHFYLFDNASTDGGSEILKPYRDAGIVTLHTSEKNPIKPMAYEYTLKTYGNDNRWIGFLDCDEFLVPAKIDDVKEILEEFEKYPALAVNWKLFGAAGKKKKPPGMVTENYLLRRDEKKNTEHPAYHPSHIKSLVDPQKTIPSFVNPHYFLYNPFPCFPKAPVAVNENHKSVDGNSTMFTVSDAGCAQAFSPEVSYEKIAVNHYWCKSEEEFLGRKLQKPRDDNGHNRDDEQGRKEFELYNKLSNSIKDQTALKFLEKMNKMDLL